VSITLITEVPNPVIRSGMGGGVIYNRDTTRPVYIGTHGDIVGGNINKLSIIDPLTALYLPGDDDVWAMAPTGTDYNNPVPVDYVYAGRSQMHTSHSVLTAPLMSAANGLTDMNTALSTVNDQLSIISNLLSMLSSAPYAELTPGDLGVLAWTYNPAYGTQGLTFSNNTAVSARFASFEGGTVTSMRFFVSSSASAGGSLYLAIYTDDGSALLGQTADQGSLITTSSVKTCPLINPVPLQPGTVYRTYMMWRSATTQSFQLWGPSGSITSLQSDTNELRQCVSGTTALTTPPSSLDFTTELVNSNPLHAIIMVP
jgi:hypothetical protein